MNKILLIALLLSLCLVSACGKLGLTEEVRGEAKRDKNSTRDAKIAEFPFSPREEALANNEGARKLAAELKERYKSHLMDLQECRRRRSKTRPRQSDGGIPDQKPP